MTAIINPAVNPDDAYDAARDALAASYAIATEAAQ